VILKSENERIANIGDTLYDAFCLKPTDSPAAPGDQLLRYKEKTYDAESFGSAEQEAKYTVIVLESLISSFSSTHLHQPVSMFGFENFPVLSRYANKSKTDESRLFNRA
jgi:hypothetical protein